MNINLFKTALSLRYYITYIPINLIVRQRSKDIDNIVDITIGQ